MRRFSTGAQGWFGRWVSLALVWAILCGLVLTGCQISLPTLSASDPQRIVLGTTGKIRTLDPADSYEIISGNLLFNLGDRLYTLRPGSSQIVPQLATQLPILSNNGLTYKIPLRRGIKFHDGEPFDAKAMAFSLQRFIENKGNPSSLLGKFVKSVAATDAYELTIQLEKPFAGFTQVLAFPGLCAVSPKAYQKGENAFNPETFVGTGPYTLASYSSDRIRLDLNSNYWGEKPKNQGIDIQIFGNSASLYNAIKTKAIDAAFQTLDPNQAESLRQGVKTGTYKVAETEGLGVHYLSMNVKSPPLDQPLVRQALAAMIDRKLLSDRVFLGQVAPLYSLIPSGLQGQAVFEQRYGDGNIAKAKELLTKAGYSKTNPLQIDFWYRSNIGHNVLAAVIIKAIADERMDGFVKLNLQGVESATAYKNLDKGVYPIFMLDWTPDYLDPDSYMQPFMDCATGSVAKGCEDGESFYQGSFYYSDRANQWISQARKTTDPSQRQKLYTDLQNLLATDVPFIPLWSSKDFLFTQANINGAVVLPTSQIPFSLMEKQQR